MLTAVFMDHLQKLGNNPATHATTGSTVSTVTAMPESTRDHSQREQESGSGAETRSLEHQASLIARNLMVRCNARVSVMTGYGW